METVKIPDGFFLEEAKKEYYDYQSRHVNELLQNSVDAGATEIYFNFEDTSLEIIDNGSGMSKERMIDALLTLGGSWKEQGSTGCFGASKKLTLFSHKSYTIHSLNTYVEGSVLRYNFIENGYFNGTKIKVEFLPGYNYSKDKLISKLETSLKACNLKSKVFINGAEFTDWKVLPFKRDYGWCKLYASETKKFFNYLYVRKNGLQMFSTYVNGLDRDIYIEVEGSSLELFTQNRDGFTGAYRDKFSALTGEMNVDKKSFLRGNNTTLTIFRGKERFWKNIISKILSEINESIPAAEVSALTNMSESEVIAFFNSRVSASNFNKVINILDGARKNIPVDFVIDLSNSDHLTCPPEYSIDNMLSKHKFLANLWKNSLILISKVLNEENSFRIGWTFDNERLACYVRKDGENSFLINPTCEKFAQRKNIKQLVFDVISTACHEYCHLNYTYHDENFAGALTDMAAKIFMEVSWRELVAESREDTVFCIAS